MNNPNSPINKIKKGLIARWQGEDYPGAKPRFQIKLFAQDCFIFLCIPIVAILVFKSCESAFSNEKRPNRIQQRTANPSDGTGNRSQILEFGAKAGGLGLGVAKRSPGTLIKVRLLNVIETYSNAPVHAQVMDEGLGKNLIGSTLIGDAVSDSNFDRINITFRHLRDLRRESVAIPISARALSLNGTLGLVAQKKEEFFARSALNSSSKLPQDAEEKAESSDLKHVIARALTSGLLQEFASESQIAQNRARVLTLKPLTEFFVELTDYFPGNNK